MVVLGLLLSIDHVPGTDISLTVPYAAEGPGPMFDTLGEVEGDEVIEVTGAETFPTTGQLNMTTVAVRSRLTLPQAMARWLFTDDTLVPIEQVFPPNLSPEEVERANQLAFSSSEAAAAVAALNYLDKPLQVEVAGLVDDAPAEGLVEEGDRVLQLDGDPLERPSAVRDRVLEHEPGDEVSLTLLRGEEEKEVRVTLGENPMEKGQAQLGVLMSAVSADGVEIGFHLQDVGGPSAGMIFTLAAIDKMTQEDLTDGRFVAGTGSIDEDGSVGEIGGIVHKVRAARDKGAELFLAPAGNCRELTGEDTSEMTVARVGTIDDAVHEIQAFSSGQAVTTCEAE